MGQPDVGDHADRRARPPRRARRCRRGRARPSRARAPRCCRTRASSVSGTPASLLYDPGLACTANSGASAAAVRSLVPVLPAEPVMPTTMTSPSAARATRPRSASAANASRPAPPRRARGATCSRDVGDQRDLRAARERVGDEVVAVALGDERDEARAGLDDARVDRERRRAGAGRPCGQGAARDGRQLGGGQLHPSAPSSSRATTRSSNGSVRPSAKVWPVSWPLPAMTTTSPGRAVGEGAGDRGAAVELHPHRVADRRGRGAPRRRWPAGPRTGGCRR